MTNEMLINSIVKTTAKLDRLHIQLMTGAVNQALVDIMRIIDKNASETDLAIMVATELRKIPGFKAAFSMEDAIKELMSS